MSRAVVAGMLLCVLALAGCVALAQLADLQSDLNDAGYNATNVNQSSTTAGDVLSVQVMMADAVPTDEDADEIAAIAWRKYRGDFDELVIVINGKTFMDVSADALTAKFGQRPADLEASKSDRSGSNVLTIVLVLVGAVVFGGLIVLLWLRGRRVPPPPYPQPPQYQQPPESP